MDNLNPRALTFLTFMSCGGWLITHFMTSLQDGTVGAVAGLGLTALISSLIK